MEYRIATDSDINTLADLRIQMLCEDNILSDQQGQIISENTKQFFFDGFATNSVICRIAIDHDAIIGMGCITFFCLPPNDWCPAGKTAYIGNLYILPVFRRKGIAAKILTQLMNDGETHKCQRILLHTTEKGKHLYETFGFEDSPATMACYPDYE